MHSSQHEFRQEWTLYSKRLFSFLVFIFTFVETYGNVGGASSPVRLNLVTTGAYSGSGVTYVVVKAPAGY